MKVTPEFLLELADMPPEAIPAMLRLVAKHMTTRSSGAERQKRYRERHSNVTNNVTSDAGVTLQVSPKEKSPTPPKEITPSTSEAKASSVGIRATLARVLDSEHVEAVIAHRKAKRAPMTLRAAELLAKDFEAAGDPNDNADEMIRRGWTGYKPEWRDKATGPPRRESQNGMLALLVKEKQRREQLGETEPDAFDAFSGRPFDDSSSRRDAERGHANGGSHRAPTGQGTGRFGASSDAGPIIDLEAEPRPPR